MVNMEEKYKLTIQQEKIGHNKNILKRILKINLKAEC